MTTEAPRLRAAPLFMRLLEAMILRRDLYERVAADREAWRPAAAIVCVSSLAYSAIMRETPYVTALVAAIGNWMLLVVILFGLIRWLITTVAVYLASLLLARQHADFGRLLRCLGFAQAPAVAAALGLVVDESIASWLPLLVGAWLLVSTVGAVRYALGVGIGRAVAIGVLGYGFDAVLPALVGVLVMLLAA